MIGRLVNSVLAVFGVEMLRIKPKNASYPGNPFEVQKMLLAGLGVKSPIVLDVGAHKGETVFRYKARFDNPVVHSFEPFPDSFNVLNERYGDDESVIINPLAVSDKPGSRTFYVNELDATNSLLPRPTDSRRYYPRQGGLKEAIQVDVTSIDEYVSSRELDTVHVLKFDIQGGELMALRGAVNVLEKMRVPLIYTEIQFIQHYEDNPLFYEVWGFLSDHGYALFDIYDLRRAGNGQLRQGNAIFVTDETRANVIDKFQDEP